MSVLPRRVMAGLVLALFYGLCAAPLARAQPGPLYFPATGHHLIDDQGFLSYWQEHDGERLLGYPITEVLEIEGLAVQYFERGRLEQHIDPQTGAAQVRTGRVAAEYAELLWRRFAPAPPRKPVAGEQRFEETGHTLRAPFLAFWQAAGGVEFFGPPISEPLWELTERGRRQVQYFERARLERDASLARTPEEIQVSDLGRALALLRGLDIAPVANWGATNYGPPAPVAPDVAVLGQAPTRSSEPAAEQAQPAPAQSQPAPAQSQPAPATPQPPARRPAPPAAGDKHIVVDLSEQWLYAYNGDTLVFDAPVATGRDGMNTPTGTFSIYAKLESQTMDGVTDGVPWVVPDVPHVMYIHGGVALHGTYWHNLFGTGARPSHGCINLPLKSAAWLYDWAPLGTSVRVTH